MDNLRNFAQQFVDGELEPYIKSEPIPEDNDGPVKVRRAMTLVTLHNSLTFYGPCSFVASLEDVFVQCFLHMLCDQELGRVLTSSQLVYHSSTTFFLSILLGGCGKKF